VRRIGTGLVLVFILVAVACLVRWFLEDAGRGDAAMARHAGSAPIAGDGEDRNSKVSTERRAIEHTVDLREGSAAPPRADGRALVGVVRDLNHQLVRGARVQLFADEPSGLAGSTLSDGNGEYRLEPWPTSEAFRDRPNFDLRVRVTADGYAPLRVKVRAAVDTWKSAGDQPLDLWLTRGGVLLGKVIRASDGRPVVGASIELHAELTAEDPPTATATSTADGSFEISPIPARSVGNVDELRRDVHVDGNIVVRADGFVLANLAVPRVEEDDRIEQTIALVACAKLIGRVVDLHGRPDVGATVGLFGPPGVVLGDRNPLIEYAPSYAITDLDGRYEMPSAPVYDDPRGVTLEAWFADPAGPDHGFVREGGYAVVKYGAGDLVEVRDICLPRRAGVWLHLRDPDGSAPGFARIEVDQRGGFTRRFDVRGTDPIRLMLMDWGMSSVDTDVRFHGRVSVEGFAPTPFSGIASRESEPAHLTIDLLRERALRGVVLQANGSPARRTTVTVVDANAPVESVREHFAHSGRGGDLPNAAVLGTAAVRSDGSFELRGLADGRVHLVACRTSSQNGQDADVDVLADQGIDGTERRLTLPVEQVPPPPPTATVVAHIDDAVRKHPLVALDGVILDTMEFPIEGRLVAPGVVRFDSVPLGPCCLRVDRDDRAACKRSFRVETEAVVEVTLTITDGCSTRLRLSGANLSEAKNVELQLRSTDGNLRIKPEDDGTFQLKHLVEGAKYEAIFFARASDGSRRVWIAANATRVCVTEPVASELEFTVTAAGWVKVDGKRNKRLPGHARLVFRSDPGLDFDYSGATVLPFDFVAPVGKLTGELTLADGTVQRAEVNVAAESDNVAWFDFE